METALVRFQVVADFSVLGKTYMAVDDGATNPGVAPDVHMVIQNTFADIAVAIHANVVAHHAF